MIEHEVLGDPAESKAQQQMTQIRNLLAKYS